MAGPASSESEVILKILFGYYGGWAAPNIYFLGFAGVVKFGNIRIGGLSGIYNARHHERPSYNDNTIRSVYHVREYDVHKLM
ncbi:Lariat debranching enzyme -like protein [Gossypium arboreum]|uniref:Lariat debranching enzyme-like protein n=1 Tax=Gossypium arboreum TaxID=29729 RepID=A0A0B0PVD2_GOSAR|nr:Lariat debranching enzyme -like protein [Gossypium arboreum]